MRQTKRRKEVLQKRERATQRAAFENGQCLLDLKNIDDYGKIDEAKAQKILQELNTKEDLAKKTKQQNHLRKVLAASQDNFMKIQRNGQKSLQETLK